MRRTWLAVIVFVSLVAGALLFRRPPSEELRERRTFLMGTAVTIRASAPEAVIGTAVERLRSQERRLSAHLDDSEIGRVNDDPTSERALSSETARLLASALDWSRRSDGAFDPTVLPLMRLWGRDDRDGPPSEEAIAEARRRVDWRKVRLEGERLRLEPAMGLDLGGIAKGHGADETARFLRAQGVKRALIDLGGNIVVIGDRPGGGPWRIGIQDPKKPRGERLGLIEVQDLSVVTSGNYERFFEWGGKRYGHIIDPATGRPAATGLLSVTVVCERSLDGDALATALFVMGKKRAAALAKELEEEGYAFIVVSDGLVTISPSLANSFHLEATEYALETR